MIDRQTKQFMSNNLTKTQKHTHIITNWKRRLSISRSPAVITAVAAVGAVVAAVGAVVEAVASVRAIVAAVASIGAIAAIIDDEVAASPLDHRKLLEPLRQPVDPKGETLHAPVLVHCMLRLDVAGHANIFNFLKALLSRSVANLVSLKNGSSSVSLVAGSFPFSNFLQWRLSSSSSSLHPRFAGGGPLDAISYVISR
jgi:hypothetical protein